MGRYVAELVALILQAQTGNAQAFSSLFQQFRATALQFASRRLGDVHLAEDVVQEAFAEAFQSLPGLRQPAAFPHWLRLLVGKHCNRLERRRAGRFAALEAEVEDDGGAAPGRSDGEFPQDVVRDCVERMPRQRRVAAALLMAGYGTGEIADMLGESPGTIKKRLSDAREQLRRELGDGAADLLRLAADGASSARYFADQGLAPTPIGDCPALRPVAALPTGKSPAGMALDPLARRLYVANERVGESAGSLSVFDLDTHALLAVVPAGRRPWSLAHDATGRRLYVTHYFQRQIAVLDLDSHAWLTPIPVAGNPASIAYDRVSHRILVASLADPGQGGQLAGLSAFDADSHAPVAVVPVGSQEPSAGGTVCVRVDPVSRHVYVARSGLLLTLDGGSLNPVHAFRVGIDPPPTDHRALHRPNPMRSFVYFRQPPSTRIPEAPLGAARRTQPAAVYDMAVDPRYRGLYLTLVNDGVLFRGPDLRRSAAALIPVDLQPLSLDIDAQRSRVYVCHGYKGSISVLCTQTDQLLAVVPVTRNVPAALGACGGLRVDPVSGRVYVNQQDIGVVLVLEPGPAAEDPGFAAL